MEEVKSLNFNIEDDFDTVKSYVNENKDNFKNKCLKNTLRIKGIGEKYLKIENNFYSWNDIEKAVTEYKNGEKIEGILLSILSWLFKDVNVEDIYVPKKFRLNENFDNVKKEILSHKAYYKSGLISGIGENNIKITTPKGKDYYIEWNELEKIIDDVKYSTLDDLEEKRFSSSIIRQLYVDNTSDYSDIELDILNEEYGKIKLKFYHLCIKGKLSYKIIKENIEDRILRKNIVESSLNWNNGQLPLSINDEGVNHIILSQSTLVRADLRYNDHFTKILHDEVGLNLKVYATEYSDEYVYHTHQYQNLIKFERDCSKWIITYNNKNLLQNAFRKSIYKNWNCEVTTAKSTEVCTVLDYNNQSNEFDPELFVKLYEENMR